MNEVRLTKKYIDFDKIENKLYINYYLEDIHLSVKTSIEFRNDIEENIKIEKFSMNHSVYLTDC